MCILKACEEPTAAGVYWRDDEEWKQYPAPHAKAIRRGMADHATRVELGTVHSSKYARGAQYAVDLTSMKQTNLDTGFTRDVQVVNAPAIGSTSSDDIDSVRKQLRDCQKEIVSLKVLLMAEIMSLKELVLKVEADVLAVNSKLEARSAKLEEQVSPVSAKVSIANEGLLGELWGFLLKWVEQF